MKFTTNLILLSYLNFVKRSLKLTPFHPVFKNLRGDFYELSLVSFVFGFFAYQFVCLYFFEGRSLGKKTFGLQVISLDYKKIGFFQALTRAILHPTYYFFPLVSLWNFVSKDKSGFPCFFSRTRVRKMSRVAKINLVAEALLSIPDRPINIQSLPTSSEKEEYKKAS